MLLEGRTAIIYGGGGTVGGAIGRAFAREGAEVHLCGRTASSLQAVADDIIAAGGLAQAHVVDALDEAAVVAHVDAVVQRSGRLDISVNVISDQDEQGTPIVEMDVEDYLRPVLVSVRSKFITQRAAARHMMRLGSGVLLTFGGPFDYSQTRKFNVGGIGVTFDAVESMRRQLAVELGRYNIRVITLLTGGIPESIPGETAATRQLRDYLTKLTLTGRTAALEDVGNVAVFAASDLARSVTAATINISAGATID